MTPTYCKHGSPLTAGAPCTLCRWEDEGVEIGRAGGIGAGPAIRHPDGTIEQGPHITEAIERQEREDRRIVERYL